MADLRTLPRVDDLASSPSLAGFPDAVRKRAARQAIAEARESIRGGQSAEEPEGRAAEIASRESLPTLRHAINATGVILHTGLGRARLAPSVAEHVARVAGAHSTLEFEEETGRRGDRQAHVRRLLVDLVGCEDAFVVNNAAAGVHLTLTALCQGREVVLSRGEMVEIGGAFRLPDIVRSTGCVLVEVGCTNKTRLSDYQSALSPDTAAILRCHPSNYKIVGFTSSADVSELAALARAHECFLIDDQGNGSLIEPAKFGLVDTFSLPISIRGGADIAIASGDKLLGGPQAGLIVGKKALIERLKSHPLARAMRIDKLCLAALEATLRLYADGREGEIPTIAALSVHEADLKRSAQRLARATNLPARVEKGISEVGGGAAPGAGLPTWRVGIESRDPEALLTALRKNEPPIVARIESDRVWLDPRTITKAEIKVVETALQMVA